MPAPSWPTAASFCARRSRSCASRASRVFSSTRSPSSRSQRSISAAMALKARARSPSSSPRSAAPTRWPSSRPVSADAPRCSALIGRTMAPLARRASATPAARAMATAAAVRRASTRDSASASAAGSSIATTQPRSRTSALAPRRSTRSTPVKESAPSLPASAASTSGESAREAAAWRLDLRAIVGQERDGDRALDLPEHQAQRTEALLGAQLRELHGVGGQAGRAQARGDLRGNALGDEARRRDLRRSRTLLERTPRYPEADPSCPDQRKHGDRNDDEEGARADAHLLRLYQQRPAAHESCRRKHAPLA